MQKQVIKEECMLNIVFLITFDISTAKGFAKVSNTPLHFGAFHINEGLVQPFFFPSSVHLALP